MVTRLRPGRIGLDSREGKGYFLFATTSGPTLGPTHRSVQSVLGVLSLGGKRPGRELTSNLHIVARLRIYAAILPFLQYVFIAWCLVKQWIWLHGVVLS